MKPILSTLVATAALCVTTLSLAQASQAPVTRAQVKADLIQVENAGYHPGRKESNYPVGIQAAEAKIHAQQPDDKSYGGVSGNGMSTSGTSATPVKNRTGFGHH